MAKGGLTAAGFMLGLGLLLTGLPLSATAAPRPIEGHENWKLGMTMAEAMAAEPRASPYDCPPDACLRYYDQRFPNTTVAVSGSFGQVDRLGVIVVTMVVEPGDNRCNRVYAQLAAFYTAAHGVVAPVSKDAWIWNSPTDSLSLINSCKKNDAGVINIVFEATAAAAPVPATTPDESHAFDSSN